MAWMKTYDEIKGSGDQQQIDFIDNITKNQDNTWIQGFAGSGKSVVLVHSLVNIINNNPSATVCIIVFTNSLVEMFKAGLEELKVPTSHNGKRNIFITTYHKFIQKEMKFDYIFCDEVQDMTRSVLENIKNRTLKQLIVAGDSNQSIYDKDPNSKEFVVDVNEIGNLTSSEPYLLETIHRLTKSIVEAVSSLLPNLNILSAKQNRTDTDVSVRLAKGQDKKQECEYILEEANNALSADQSVVILLPYHDTIEKFINLVLEIKNIAPWDAQQNLNQYNRPDYSKLHNYLKQYDLNIEYLGNGYGDLYNANNQNKIIIMTYHSAKGLDFDNVFLPFLSTGTFYNSFSKTLFMVGMTRSKKNLYLTYSETKHQYLDSIKSNCKEIDINNNSNDDDFEFDF